MRISIKIRVETKVEKSKVINLVNNKKLNIS